MPSKALDEFLKNAPPEIRANVERMRGELQQAGVQPGHAEPQRSEPNTPTAERADVRQVGQDLKQSGAQLKEDANGPQTPARMGESRPHADSPKFMDEQRQSSQTTIAQNQRSDQQDLKGVELRGEAQTMPSGQQTPPQQQAPPSPPQPPKTQDMER
jgi:hypothetical protein